MNFRINVIVVSGILAILILSTLNISNAGNLQVNAQEEEHAAEATMTNATEGNVVRDSEAVLLEGLTIPSQGFIHLYDSTPYMITNGHVAANIPCEDNSTASLNILIGQAPNLTNAELENIPELSNPGTMCLYHADIPPAQNFTVTDIAVQNPADSDLELPASSTIVIGVNEIMSGAEHHDE